MTTTTTTQHVDYPHEPGRLHDCPACEARCHCRPGEAECVFEGEHVDRRVAEAEAYVRTRFYPPLPYEYGGYAVQAIDACNANEEDREILLDPDLPTHPREATWHESGSVSISAARLVDALRLWHMVTEPCPDCEGSGEIHEVDSTGRVSEERWVCETCRGAGMV